MQKHFCDEDDYNEDRKYNSVISGKQSDFRHQHLQKLHVSGFEVQEKFLTFVRLVMERATNLKAVVLADGEPCGQCDFANDPTSSPTESRYPKNDDEKCSIAKQLRDQFSSVQIFVQ